MLRIPERPTRRLVGSIYRHPYLYLLGALVLTAAALWVGRGIGLKSNIRDLLPESAPSVKATEELQRRLGSADILVVTLMTDDFDRVKLQLAGIAEALAAHPDIVKVAWHQDVRMIDQNALTIFPSLPELEDYYKDLTAEIKKAVKKGMRLFDDDDDPDAVSEEDTRHTYAWAELERDDGLSNLGRTFRAERGQYPAFFYNRAYTTLGLHIYPAQSSGDLAFCRSILKTVEDIVNAQVTTRLGPIGPGGVVTRVDLGGGYRNALQESKRIKGDMISSAGLSLLLLTLVVMVFFRSVRAFFCVLVPVIMGTIWTVGFVTLTVGYLNLITAFIFAVLLGLGIDFGIHYYGRYREERAAGCDPLEAMVRTAIYTGEASVLAAVTTGGAFLALTLADFRGFSQFGGVAAAGLFFCLLAVMLVFPAVTFIFERWMPLRLLGYKVDRDGAGEIRRRRFPLGARTVVAAAVLGVVGLGVALKNVDFELNFDRLGEKVSAEKAEHQKIQYGTVQSTAPAVIFATSAEEARSLYEQLEAKTAEFDDHPRIKSYQTLFALVPKDQEAKTKWVNKICRKLRRKVKLFEGDQRDGADELLKHCEPVPFGVDDLPDWVRAKFTDKDGRLGEFIFVAPRGSTSDGKVALAFREEMLSLRGLDGEAPVVSGKPMIWAEVIIAMKHDGLLTTIASLIVVLLLLLAFERNALAVVVILLPLVVGVGISGLVMVLVGIKLNFFNMLALPTIIGMGVDDGVHMYHRYKELGRGSSWYIVRTTGMSAVVTTLTTSIGFGSLMMANHYGLNSLGLLTVIGMVSALLTTLVVLPAAFQWLDNRKAKA